MFLRVTSVKLCVTKKKLHRGRQENHRAAQRNNSVFLRVTSVKLCVTKKKLHRGRQENHRAAQRNNSVTLRVTSVKLCVTKKIKPMNQQLQTILDFIQQNEKITAEEKDVLLKAIKKADSDLTISEFKLERTEKVKRTTAILLEETIEELEQKRKSIEETNSALQKSLDDLNAAQTQLIQSEKMASLGELTAGIAHEIQNPLNFVNNFSEINTELVDELQAEIKSGNTQEAISISNDIKENSEKINHHGNRAGDIVKGMLQHSQSSKGQKESIDINALCDEYLRLSYHGLRAKDKMFNAELKTDFDESIGNINIIPQDIGRVLLNLYNNAFYEVNQKLNAHSSQLIANYQPTVSVTTKKSDNHVTITVSDNGNGIPQNIVDKIFQPFFTTKPTGQGTGLGLSLSYDIVKTHGGEIKVVSKEGKGTEFKFELPVV